MGTHTVLSSFVYVCIKSLKCFKNTFNLII